MGSHFRKVVTLGSTSQALTGDQAWKSVLRVQGYVCVSLAFTTDALHMAASDFCDKERRKSRWCTFADHNSADVNFLHLLRRQLLVL